jgi:hypothetical protein
MTTELDRRSLIKLGGAALALPALPGQAFAAKPQNLVALLVLVDRRYQTSMLFAAAREGPGVEVLAVGRDLARLWYEDIAPRLVRRPLLIEAVTLPADLFGIERLAEGSGASTEARLNVVGEGRPQRGCPKHLVYWRMRLDSRPDAAIG